MEFLDRIDKIDITIKSPITLDISTKEELRVEIAPTMPGPKGDPGPQGPPGDSGASSAYIHTQMVASDIWVVSHTLDKKPSVTIVDTGDNVVHGDILYITNGLLQITFSDEFSGKAYLN